MAGRIKRLFTRAALPTLPKAGLGNLLVSPKPAGGGPNATSPVTWVSPGNPQIFDQDVTEFGKRAYLGHAYVMRCINTIAETIAGLDFRSGPDPTTPANTDPTSPLSQLLGPGTPQAPGGPNADTSSYAFWLWSIVQYLVYGRFAWECDLLTPKATTNFGKKVIVGLWPMPVEYLSPVPSMGGRRYFDEYVWQTPQTGETRMKPEQLVYCWKPSLIDWRQPQSFMSSAKLPIFVAMGLDKYIAKLLENNMVASTLIVTPPFDEPSARRAWQEQFMTLYTGVDNTGKTVFAEAEADETDTTGRPSVQVERLAQTMVEASMTQLAMQAKIDITVAFGVPLSLIGNASQRTYSNADMEYRNFWTITALPLIKELQEHVNVKLAPRLGTEVGWFDLSRVAALKPPSIFAPPMVGDVIASGVATPAQVANVLQIPAADDMGAADIETVDIGEESNTPGGNAGGRSIQLPRYVRVAGCGEVTAQSLVAGYMRYQTRPLTTWNWDEPFEPSRWIEREHIEVRSAAPAPEVIAPSADDVADALLRRVERAAIRNRRERSMAARRAAAIDVRHQLESASSRALGIGDPKKDPALEVYARPPFQKTMDEGLTDTPDAQETCRFCDSPATKIIEGESGAIQVCNAHPLMAMDKLGIPNDVHQAADAQVADVLKHGMATIATPVRAESNPVDVVLDVLEEGDDFDAWYTSNHEALLGIVQ